LHFLDAFRQSKLTDGRHAVATPPKVKVASRTAAAASEDLPRGARIRARTRVLARSVADPYTRWLKSQTLTQESPFFGPAQSKANRDFFNPVDDDHEELSRRRRRR
jgi:hypothetical protein